LNLGVSASGCSTASTRLNGGDEIAEELILDGLSGLGAGFQTKELVRAGVCQQLIEVAICHSA
jgi:hypothetical protein